MGETPKSSANDWNPAQSTPRESLVAEEPRPSAKALPVAPVRSRAARSAAATASQSSPSVTDADPTLGAERFAFSRSAFAAFMMRDVAVEPVFETPCQRRPPPIWDIFSSAVGRRSASRKALRVCGQRAEQQWLSYFVGAARVG